MRPVFLAVPSILALACAGGMLALAMRAKPGSSALAGFEWRHFVTPPMAHDADAHSGKVAARFDVKDSRGTGIVIGGTGLRRPQFVYFVNTECPCTYAAEPLFHSLAEQFHGQVDFVAVTNGSADKTKQWVSEMDVPYPVVADPKLEMMKAYGAPASVYSALITQDGRIAKLWPGFSRGFLLDMNHSMALAAARPEKPFDTQYAPEKPATGCAFSIVSIPKP